MSTYSTRIRDLRFTQDGSPISVVTPGEAFFVEGVLEYHDIWNDRWLGLEGAEVDLYLWDPSIEEEPSGSQDFIVVTGRGGGFLQELVATDPDSILRCRSVFREAWL